MITHKAGVATLAMVAATAGPPGWLVEDQYLRVRQQRPGQGDSLMLAAGYSAAVLADLSGESGWERAQPAAEADLVANLEQVIVARFGTGQSQVLSDAGVEEVRVLGAAADDRTNVAFDLSGSS